MPGIFRLTGLQVEEGTLCHAGQNPRAKIMLFKSRARRPEEKEAMPKTQRTKKNAGAEGGEQTDPTKILEGLSDDQKAAVAQLLAAKDEQIAELQRSKADEDGAGDGEEEEVEQAQAGEGTDDGGVPESEKQGTGTTVTVAMSKAEKRIAELEKALAAERTLRLQREYLEKARSFDAIPVPTDKVAELMRVVAEKAKDQAPILDMVLKACSELALSNSAITKSLGTANGKGSPSTAKAEIDAEVSKLMAEEKITKAKATERLFKARPELYRRYREEQEKRS